MKNKEDLRYMLFDKNGKEVFVLNGKKVQLKNGVLEHMDKEAIVYGLPSKTKPLTIESSEDIKIGTILALDTTDEPVIVSKNIPVLECLSQCGCCKISPYPVVNLRKRVFSIDIESIMVDGVVDGEMVNYINENYKSILEMKAREKRKELSKKLEKVIGFNLEEGVEK